MLLGAICSCCCSCVACFVLLCCRMLVLRRVPLLTGVCFCVFIVVACLVSCAIVAFVVVVEGCSGILDCLPSS